MPAAEIAQPAVDVQAGYASEISRARSSLARKRIFAFGRIFLWGTLFAAPLAFGAVQPWAWCALAITAAVLLVLWAAGNFRGGTIRVYWSPIYLPAAAFLVVAAVQYFAGLTLDRAATQEALCKLTTDFALFFLAGQFLAEVTEPQWRRMGLAITLYTLAVGVFATLQFSSSHNLIYWVVPSPGYTFGPYVNHNHYAGLMEMLIPLSAASVVSRVPLDRAPRASLPNRALESGIILLGFAVLIPAASLLLSGSRGGFISLIVELVLAAILIFARGPRRSRKTAAVAGGAAILAAVLLFFWMAPRQIAERFTTMADVAHPHEVSLAERLAPAMDSLRIFCDHSLLGAGLGSFETVFPRYQSFPSDSRWDYAHNDYAQALAETGLAGGALILCALGLFFWLAFGKVAGPRRSVSIPVGAGRGGRESTFPLPTAHGAVPSAYFLRWGAALGCCGLLVHSFVDFNLHIPANAAWFAVCAAIATAGGSAVVSS